MSVKFTARLCSRNLWYEPVAECMNCVELETHRSPRLTDMMKYVRLHENLFVSLQELAKIGITVIVLPGIESLFSDQGPFRPHSPYNQEILDTSGEGLMFEDKDSEVDLIESYSDLTHDLLYASRKMFQENLISKGVDESNTTLPWQEID